MWRGAYVIVHILAKKTAYFYLGLAPATWQAIRHARRVGGSFPMAGEKWREEGLVPRHG